LQRRAGHPPKCRIEPRPRIGRSVHASWQRDRSPRVAAPKRARRHRQPPIPSHVRQATLCRVALFHVEPWCSQPGGDCRARKTMCLDGALIRHPSPPGVSAGRPSGLSRARQRECWRLMRCRPVALAVAALVPRLPKNRPFAGRLASACVVRMSVRSGRAHGARVVSTGEKGRAGTCVCWKLATVPGRLPSAATVNRTGHDQVDAGKHGRAG
jgi:hypothetical protein